MTVLPVGSFIDILVVKQVTGRAWGIVADIVVSHSSCGGLRLLRVSRMAPQLEHHARADFTLPDSDADSSLGDDGVSWVAVPVARATLRLSGRWQ